MNRPLKRCRMAFAIIGLACLAATGRAGSLEAPAAPASSASALWTLDDLYTVLNTRTTNVAKRAGPFAEPAAGPAQGTLRTYDEIMALATNRAAVAKTGQTSTFNSRDDGSLKVGVAWPNPRFTIGTNAPGQPNDTNCVTDNLTGLMWARNANLAGNTAWSAGGTCLWAAAFDVITNSAGPVNGTAYGGYTDWRLPNALEMQSLLAYGWHSPALPNTAGTAKWAEGDPFHNVQTNSQYWTSTTRAASTGMAYSGDLLDGFLYTYVKTSTYWFMWPVRGGGQ